MEMLCETALNSPKKTTDEYEQMFENTSSNKIALLKNLHGKRFIHR